LALFSRFIIWFQENNATPLEMKRVKMEAISRKVSAKANSIATLDIEWSDSRIRFSAMKVKTGLNELGGEVHYWS
jgi:hypothetical protein